MSVPGCETVSLSAWSRASCGLSRAKEVNVEAKR